MHRTTDFLSLVGAKAQVALTSQRRVAGRLHPGGWQPLSHDDRAARRCRKRCSAFARIDEYAAAIPNHTLRHASGPTPPTHLPYRNSKLKSRAVMPWDFLLLGAWANA
jgi:hypothetical protein